LKKHTSHLPILVLGLLLIWAVSCSPAITTYAVKTKKVDLRNYKTYAWAIPEDSAGKSRYDDKVYARFIIDVTNTELAKKGFVIDTENPDALFVFDTRLEEHVEYSQSPSVSVGFGYGGPYYYGGVSAPVSGGTITASPYYKGLLFINMYDANTQQLLWKGWAEEKMSYERAIDEDIKTAIRKMFMRLSVQHK
jgi:hypothetical protein